MASKTRQSQQTAQLTGLTGAKGYLSNKLTFCPSGNSVNPRGEEGEKSISWTSVIQIKCAPTSSPTHLISRTATVYFPSRKVVHCCSLLIFQWNILSSSGITDGSSSYANLLRSHHCRSQTNSRFYWLVATSRPYVPAALALLTRTLNDSTTVCSAKRAIAWSLEAKQDGSHEVRLCVPLCCNAHPSYVVQEQTRHLLSLQGNVPLKWFWNIYLNENSLQMSF